MLVSARSLRRARVFEKFPVFRVKTGEIPGIEGFRAEKAARKWRMLN
jgi:hypothetical protein